MACHVRKMQTRDNYLHTSADMARHVPTFMIMKHPLSSAESEGFLLRGDEPLRGFSSPPFPTIKGRKSPTYSLSSAESEGFLLRKRCAVTNPSGGSHLLPFLR